MKTSFTRTAGLAAVATLTVPQGGNTFNVGVFAIDAANAYLAASAGTAALSIKTGVNGRFEPLLDADGVQVSVSLIAPVTMVVEAADVREIKATPALLAGANVVGIELAVSAW